MHRSSQRIPEAIIITVSRFETHDRTVLKNRTIERFDNQFYKGQLRHKMR